MSLIFSRVSILLALTLAACQPEQVAGIPVDTPLNEMTDEEWQALCQWRFELRGEGELTRYWCGADRVPVEDEPPDFPKAIHRWETNVCTFYNSTRDSCVEPCPRTVRQFVDCAIAADATQCFHLDVVPECLILDRPCGECP